MGKLLAGSAAGCLVLALPWPWLPPPAAAVAGMAVGTGLLGIRGLFRGRFRSGVALGDLSVILGGFLLGLGWSLWAHDRALAQRLGTPPGSPPSRFEALVVSEPEPAPRLPGQGPAVRFHARVPPDAVLRLTWRDAPEVRRGERWLLTASVKGPWGYANPGGVDFERWMLGRGLHGSGYVRAGTRLSRDPPGAFGELRTALNRFVASAGLEQPGVIQALLTGSTGAIGAAQWELFRRTGTVHLVVVSGLHIGLAAAAGSALGLGGARLLGLCVPGLLLWLNARQLAALFGAALCTGYLLVSGAGVPAQRAWLMALAALLALAWGRRVNPRAVLLLAIAWLLLTDPLRVHLQGFWLSVGAVTLLLAGFHGRYLVPSRTALPAADRVRQLLRTQWIIGLGLAPLLLGLTGVFSISAWPANLLAVPTVSLVLVPLVLMAGALSVVQPELAVLLLRLADCCVSLLLAGLHGLADVPLLHRPARWGLLGTAQIAALWMIAAPPCRGRAALLLAALLWLPASPSAAPLRQPAIPTGQFRVMALDVGQGSAIVVDTAGHRLLFDAGPAFPGGFETGSAVVAPSLVATGRGALDVLVLSHDDLDHVGGAAYLGRTFPVRRWLSSFATPGAASCHGRAWAWDGVVFRFLRLPRPRGASDNDLSCVLLVSNGRRRLLLAGDVGAAVERVLVRALDGPLTLMFAPHHGSGESSSRALVRVARPRLVFVSAALGNRYGHPHPRVLARYREVGARVYQTGRQGALVWRSDRPNAVLRWRSQRGPYWRSQVDGLTVFGVPSSR